jgi:soluble cytochrome b562
MKLDCPISPSETIFNKIYGQIRYVTLGLANRPKLWHVLPPMKLIHLTRYLLLSLVVISVPQSGFLMADEEEHTPLGEAMEDIGGAWRRVKRQVNDPSKNAATIALVAQMQAAAAEAAKHKPELLAETPAGDKKAFMEGYLKGMKAFSANLNKLSVKLKAGDNKAAADIVAKLDEIRKKGHTNYKKPEE